ncbi:uncharacterized protein L201_002202 [Kwoniella dendrophila CBS 6074]|uniref:BRCT domain-containing protein n=1 Tax=Kwoniella dendrophila CBS 6074 TaxID=1295534 RepID=A0AAX4JS45_9TREE
MTTRRLGLTKPISRSPMPLESQSQDSTQQPSIEIRPSIPSSSFILPLSSVPEASSDLSEPPEESASFIPDSHRDEGVSGSSVEETGESGLAWTQSQVTKNQQAEEEKNRDDFDRERSQDEVITSPDPAIESPVRPRQYTQPPGSPPVIVPPSTPPISPTTTGKQLEDSLPLQDRSADKENTGLEDTEVDLPHVETPQESESPSSRLSSQGKDKTTVLPEALGSNRQLRGVTSYSPSKIGAQSHSAKADTTRKASTTFSPIGKLRSTYSLCSKSKQKKVESQDSEESLFGKEPVITQQEKPYDRFLAVSKSNLAEKLTNGPSRINSNTSTNISTEEEEEQIEERPLTTFTSNHTKDGVNEDDDEDETDNHETEEQEDDEAGINWDQTLGNENVTGVDTMNNDTSHSQSPVAQTSRIAAMMSSSPTKESHPTANRSMFNQLANSGSVSSQKADLLSGGLFSDPGEEVGDDPETQRSIHFQATQMAPQVLSSPPRIGSLSEEPQLQATYEATQPDEIQKDGPLAEKPQHQENLNAVPRPQPSVSRAPSNFSTTSKISVPSHRQLARRSRAEDASNISIASNHQPARSNLLPDRPVRSEVVIPAVESSPFKKTPPHRASSESRLQETFKDSFEKGSSSLENATAKPSSPPQRVTEPENAPLLEETALNYTSPPSPPVSPHRGLSPTSPSLNATRHPDLEATKANSPSLPPVSSPQISPTKYKSRAKRKRIPSTSPSIDENDLKSDSSGSTPIDEEDHTYQPIIHTKKAKSRGVSSAASSRRQASSPPVQAPASTSKRKRRPVVRSSSLSNPPSDSQSSSPAPEDPEDNTYQPSLLPKIKLKLDKGKGKEKVSAPNSSASSRPPLTKKLKTNAQVARLTPSFPNTPIADSSDDAEVVPVLAACYTRYYPGKAKWTGKGYRVEFEDGEKKNNVKPDTMRKLVLRQGDQLEASTDSKYPAKFEVSADWDGNSAGVKCRSLEGLKLGRIKLHLFGISNKYIHSNFGDRLFEDSHTARSTNGHGSAGPVTDRAAIFPSRASVPRSPVKRANGYGSPSVSRRSLSPTRVTSNHLKGMIFLLTRGLPTNQNEISHSIRSQGGKIVSTWEEMFDTSSPGECGFIRNLAGAPFLVLMGDGRDGTIMTPKVMVALAKGIPCLSAKYIEDTVEQNKRLDWRSYLISPGFSDYVEHYMSQIVDIKWGEDDWDSHSAGPVRKPLQGTKVLFVLPSSKNEALKRLIPVCAYSMGVEEIQSVSNSKSSETMIKDDKWDYILFEDREYKEKDRIKPFPKYLVSQQDRLCNVHWMKQCLITGSALPPTLNVEKGEKEQKK